MPYQPKGLWRPRGRGFSMALADPAGRIVRLTGQVAWDEEERIVGRGDVGEQAHQCLRNIATALAPFGGTLDDLMEIVTYYTAPGQLAAIQRARAAALGGKRPPVSTSVMVAGLGHPDFLVEMTAVAVVPLSRFVDAGND